MSGALSKSVALSGGECTDAHVVVPQGLVAAVNANRGICQMWYQHHVQKNKGKTTNLPKCRAGARCVFKHAMDDTMDCRMPWISWDRVKQPDGTWMVVGTLRPPVAESVNACIKALGGVEKAFKMLGGAHSIIFLND